jgi:hypothetical protein
MVGLSAGSNSGDAKDGSVGHDVIFSLCEEFLVRSVSTMVDANIGWEFHSGQ